MLYGVVTDVQNPGAWTNKYFLKYFHIQRSFFRPAEFEPPA